MDRRKIGFLESVADRERTTALVAEQGAGLLRLGGSNLYGGVVVSGAQ